MTAAQPAEATVLDLEVVQRRVERHATTTGRGARAFLATALAADVPPLLDAVDLLAAALAALLRLDECPTTGPEYQAAVEEAHAALESIGQPAGGAR